MGPAPGLATQHAYMGEAGRLPGMDATTCCTGWTKFFFFPLERATTGVGGGGGVPGHRSSAHRRFTTLPTRSRRGDWIGRRSRRLSLRETSRPLEWKYVTHGEACRRGPTRHRPPQAAGRAYGSPHGGPRAGSPEWRAARDNRHIGPGSPSARRGPRPRMDDHAAGAERPDRRSGGPDWAAGGAGAADRLRERLTDAPDPATKNR